MQENRESISSVNIYIDNSKSMGNNISVDSLLSIIKNIAMKKNLLLILIIFISTGVIASNHFHDKNEIRYINSNYCITS